MTSAARIRRSWAQTQKAAGRLSSATAPSTTRSCGRPRSTARLQFVLRRSALEQDPTLPEGFLSNLFGDSAAASKAVKVLRPGGAALAGQEETERSDREVTQERERIAQEVRNRELLRKLDKRKRVGEKESPRKKVKKDKEEAERRKLVELQQRLEENIMNVRANILKKNIMNL